MNHSEKITLGIPSEKTRTNETLRERRVSFTPEVIKKWKNQQIETLVETGAGDFAGIPDALFLEAGAKLGTRSEVLRSSIVIKINRPNAAELAAMRDGSTLICLVEPHLSASDGTYETFKNKKLNVLSLEKIPRTSRAQSMDVLSSQANIAGYRAVIEAATHYPRFFPMLMTSAGSAKPAKVAVLGAGVAGLQAIGTAKRLGAQVEAFDIRKETHEQIQSLGAKVISVGLPEKDGSGAGGYAKEQTAEDQRRTLEGLTKELKRFDIVISTANIPGRKSPTLITEEAVKSMRPGSVIVDLAAANGGNCVLTKANETILAHGVSVVGRTDYPSLVPFDASQFFARNCSALLALIIKDGQIRFDFSDDIVAGSTLFFQGELRLN